MTGTAPTSDLTGWKQGSFTAAGLTHDVFEKGSGPGVVLLPEIPGVTPEVLGLADHIADQGFTVVLSSPFGEPGRPSSAGYAMATFARLCVAAEFRAFAKDARRPFADYVRALARDLAARTPGPGVGVVGMCFTGGFALAAAVADEVVAPVLSQPSLPFPVGGPRSADPGVSRQELATVAGRTKDAGLCLLGLRFSEDKGATRSRFAGLRRSLGDAFEVIELDSSKGNTGGFSGTAHAVLTEEVRDTPGHQALAARARVVAFLKERLTAEV